MSDRRPHVGPGRSEFVYITNKMSYRYGETKTISPLSSGNVTGDISL